MWVGLVSRGSWFLLRMWLNKYQEWEGNLSLCGHGAVKTNAVLLMRRETEPYLHLLPIIALLFSVCAWTSFTLLFCSYRLLSSFMFWKEEGGPLSPRLAFAHTCTVSCPGAEWPELSGVFMFRGPGQTCTYVNVVCVRMLVLTLFANVSVPLALY